MFKKTSKLILDAICKFKPNLLELDTNPSEFESIFFLAISIMN